MKRLILALMMVIVIAGLGWAVSDPVPYPFWSKVPGYEVTGDLDVTGNAAIGTTVDSTQSLVIDRIATSGADHGLSVTVSSNIDTNGPIVKALGTTATSNGTTGNSFVIGHQNTVGVASTYTAAQQWGAMLADWNILIGYAGDLTAVPTTYSVNEIIGLQSSVNRGTAFSDVDATYAVDDVYNIRAFIDGTSYNYDLYGSTGKINITNYYGVFSDNWRHPLGDSDVSVDNFYFFYADESIDDKQTPDDQVYADLCVGCPTWKAAGKYRNYQYYAQVADGGSIENVGFYAEMTGRGSAGGDTVGLIVDGDEAEAILVRKSGDAGDIFTVNATDAVTVTVNINATDPQFGLELINTSTIAAPAYATMYGTSNQMAINSAINNSIYNFTGIYNSLKVQGTGGAVGDLVGIKNSISINSNATATTFDNAYMTENVLSQSGTNGNHILTNYYGLYSHSVYSGTGTLSGTNWRHAYFTDFADTGGTVTNAAGLWIDKQTFGTNNYGIVLNGDGAGADIVLGSAQDIQIYGTSADNSITTTAEIFRLTPIAAAPATCSIGDFYVDTSGAYCACTVADTWENTTTTGTCS